MFLILLGDVAENWLLLPEYFRGFFSSTKFRGFFSCAAVLAGFSEPMETVRSLLCTVAAGCVLVNGCLTVSAPTALPTETVRSLSGLLRDPNSVARSFTLTDSSMWPRFILLVLISLLLMRLLLLLLMTGLDSLGALWSRWRSVGRVGVLDLQTSLVVVHDRLALSSVDMREMADGSGCLRSTSRRTSFCRSMTGEAERSPSSSLAGGGGVSLSVRRYERREEPWRYRFIKLWLT